MTSRIFDGEDIIIDAIEGNGDRLITTFTSFERSGGATVGGWSGTIGRLELPGMFFISKRNHWFNSPELSAAIAAANRHASRFKKNVLAGASMGGHAAVRLAQRLNASVVVAISPQLCIRHPLALYEKRWRREASAIVEYDRGIGSDDPCCPIFIIYDGNDTIDQRHAHEIAGRVKCHLIDLPDSGHSSTKALADLKILDKIFQFDGTDLNDKVLVEQIVDTFALNGWRSAWVISAKAQRLPEADRKAFLANVQNHAIGISSSKTVLEKVLRSAGVLVS